VVYRPSPAADGIAEEGEESGGKRAEHEPALLLVPATTKVDVGRVDDQQRGAIHHLCCGALSPRVC
jgi:hypothetical protein